MIPQKFIEESIAGKRVVLTINGEKYEALLEEIKRTMRRPEYSLVRIPHMTAHFATAISVNDEMTDSIEVNYTIGSFNKELPVVAYYWDKSKGAYSSTNIGQLTDIENYE